MAQADSDAEQAWQGLPKDVTKGGDGWPYMAVWDGDPEKGDADTRKVAE